MHKWYVISVVSGKENNIKTLILKKAEEKKIASYIEEIFIPSLETESTKRGKVVKLEKKLMPGYIFIKAKLTDEIWYLVDNIPNVKKISGNKNALHPISQGEMDKIFAQVESETKNVNSAKLFAIGESVKVSEGAFQGFEGTVSKIDVEKQKVTLRISIFGASTPIELDFVQVMKKTD